MKFLPKRCTYSYRDKIILKNDKTRLAPYWEVKRISVSSNSIDLAMNYMKQVGRKLVCKYISHIMCDGKLQFFSVLCSGLVYIWLRDSGFLQHSTCMLRIIVSPWSLKDVSDLFLAEDNWCMLITSITNTAC